MNREARAQSVPSQSATGRKSTKALNVSKALTPERWARARIAIVSLCVFTFGGMVVVRAYELQVTHAPQLAALASAQYNRTVRLSPKRGVIYDRNGHELAVSVDTESVSADPVALRRAHDPVVVAAQLSAILGVDHASLVAKLSSERRFVWLSRHVTPSVAAQVRAIGVEQVSIQHEARRYYPGRSLAAHILGFADIDGNGLEGVEKAYDEKLRGSNARVPALRDRRGAIVFSEQLLDGRMAQGDDLFLTIDSTIQYAAEREIELAVRTFEARAGSIVVVDPANGDILAMANYPTYDVNAAATAPPSHRRNRALTDRFEPGSSVKPFTVAGALAAGTLRVDERIDCENGAVKVAEYTIHDTHSWGALTPREILQYSSNIGAMKIGGSLGRAGLYRVFRQFGFGEETGIGLSGETGGILRHYRRWYDMDAATVAFGQGFSATTLQLAVATAALANGGRLYAPRLVRRMRSPSDGDTDIPIRLRREVVSPGIARIVSDMLASVTSAQGTGYEAAVDGFLAAGKTGTAQKADYVAGGYSPNRWTSSFVGFVPVDNPRLAIAVVVDEPMIDHLGGVVAAPVFRRVATASLAHLGVPSRLATRPARVTRPSSPRPVVAALEAPAITFNSDATASGDSVSVPSVLGLSARGAIRLLVGAGFVPHMREPSSRRHGRVTMQTPAPGASGRRGASVEFVVGEDQALPTTVDMAASENASVDGAGKSGEQP